MADDNNIDFLQKLLKFALDVLEPALEMFDSDDSKVEFLDSLGLDSSADLGSLPNTTNLEAYVNAEAQDVDEIMLLSALADFTAVTTTIEGTIRALVDADDLPDGQAVDEIVGAYLNLLLMEYVRRKSPQVHALIFLLSTLNDNAAQAGGYFTIGSALKDFFEPIGDGFDTEESTANASLLIAGLLGIGVYVVEEYLLDDKLREATEFRFGYGFEGYEGSGTPVADRITDRFISYAVTARPHDDPDNQATAYHTLGFVPKEHGGAAIMTSFAGNAEVVIPVSDDISFKVDIGGDGIFRLLEGASATPGAGNRAKITFKHKVNKPEVLRLWPWDEPKIKSGLKEYSASFEVKPDDLHLNFKAKLPFLMKRKADAGFPQSLLPEEIKEDIPIEFGYSTKNDFYFGEGGGNPGGSAEAGAAGDGASEEEQEWYAKLAAKILNKIDIQAAIHKDIGGVFGLQHLNLRTGVAGDFDKTTLEFSIDFWVKFGSPLTITMTRLGVELELEKRDDEGGFLGHEFKGKLKAPTGAGIAINASVIKGGGYLYFDEDKGEYFGAVELAIGELFELNAIGLINTRFPDDSKGFSLLVLITAEGFSVPLAFGFSLDGIGGLLGYNRTINVEAFRIGVRTNAIRSIFFPEDVVANINRIVTDLSEIFPPREGQFVVGIMARIGYQGADLIVIDLGVILELPDPKIIVAGVVRVIAPREDAEALKLQVNFLGVIDTVNEFFYFEAHLFDSHVVGFNLTGSLALVVGWGDNGLLAISVGGFHPDFNDYPSVPTLPGAFRNMSRVGFSLLSGDNPKLTVEAYFALTSNSLQFGAKVELLASGPMSFNLYGMLSFDALFIFDPFSFIISLEATLAIRRKTKVLFGISFKGKLSGTNPWHVEGEVSFGVLFFDITIGFSHTWGDSLAVPAAETVDLVGIARSELREDRNWQSSAGRGLNNTVMHRQLEALEEDRIVVFPFGELTFSQQTLPFNYEIEKYGSQRPVTKGRISIEKVKIGDARQDIDYQKELFAAGHYTNLTEREKLDRKSFERFDSGFTVRDSGKLKTSPPDLAPVNLDYELNYTDDDAPESLFAGIAIQAFDRMRLGAAVANAELSQANSTNFGLNRVKGASVSVGHFAIANVVDLTEAAEAKRASTLSEAQRILDGLIAESPELEDQLQIVNAYELAG